MKKILIISAVVVGLAVLSFSTYVFAQKSGGFKHMMTGMDQKSFDQMYDTCRNAADDDMKKFMDSYGKDKMKSMHEKMMKDQNGMMGQGMMSGKMTDMMK